MNIEEIALRVAEEIGAVAYSPPPMRAVRGYSFTFKQLEAFAHALLAELSKDAEPACWMTPDGEGWRMRIEPPTVDTKLGWTPLFTSPAPVIASEQKPVCWYDGNKFYANEESASVGCADMANLKPLFTSPPNTADIEQRVAEACAKVVLDWLDGFADGVNLADEIRTEWREYL